jgi:hypothetical protein
MFYWLRRSSPTLVSKTEGLAHNDPQIRVLMISGLAAVRYGTLIQDRK